MFYDLKSTTYRIADMMQAVTTVDLRNRSSKFSGLGDRFFIFSPVIRKDFLLSGSGH